MRESVRNDVARPSEVVDLGTKFQLVTTDWSPRIVAESNGWEIKLVRARGEFVWHRHEVDEVFLVFAGELTIQLAGEPEVHLQPGQLYVVRRGIEHRPHSAAGCHLVLLEPAGVINTGNTSGPLTAVDSWI